MAKQNRPWVVSTFSPASLSMKSGDNERYFCHWFHSISIPQKFWQTIKTFVFILFTEPNISNKYDEHHGCHLVSMFYIALIIYLLDSPTIPGLEKGRASMLITTKTIGTYKSYSSHLGHHLVFVCPIVFVSLLLDFPQSYEL